MLAQSSSLAADSAIYDLEDSMALVTKHIAEEALHPTDERRVPKNQVSMRHKRRGSSQA